MKNSRFTFSSAAKAVLFALCAVLLMPAPASAGNLLSQGINLGEAGPASHNWAIFSLGAGSDQSDFSNGSLVYGDVALAGNGKLKMSGGSMISGNVYRHTSGSVNLSGGSLITGSTINNAATNTMLAQGVNDAIAASNAAYSLSASVGYPTTINANSSLTLSGSGNVVLKLTDFVVAGGATITLQGNSSTSFVINVTDDFKLSNGAQIQLSGGLTWDNVLFNIRGSGTNISLSGGSSVGGILLAANRSVKLDNASQFNGEIIANKVALTGGSQVTRPPVVSP